MSKPSVEQGGIDWLNRRDPDRFTIQVVATRSARGVERVSRRLPTPDPRASYVKKDNGRDWHVLVFGDFATVEEAKTAISRFPEDIQAIFHGNWLRRLNEIWM